MSNMKYFKKSILFRMKSFYRLILRDADRFDRSIFINQKSFDHLKTIPPFCLKLIQLITKFLYRKTRERGRVTSQIQISQPQICRQFFFFLEISFASKIRILNSSVKQSCNFISESLIAMLISI